MNKTAIVQQAKTSSILPPAQGRLQRKCACGNHTVAGGECAECAKKKDVLQRKLTIGASNDPLEREADRVADQVMAMPAHPAVSGAPPRIQRLAAQPTEQMEAAPASVDRVLASPGRPLETTLRQDMEQRFGYDFSRVRLHTGGAAEQSAQDVNAHAYTAGHNIVFGAGQFAPWSTEGRRLLAHELTHVVQQSGAYTVRFSPSDEKHGLSSIDSPRIIQRQNYHAGGCATCTSASSAGSMAHPYVQGLFVTAYGQEIVSEAPINNPNDDNGRLDLFRIDRTRKPWIVEFGEIKPDNDKGVRQGKKDLEWYEEQLIRILRPPDFLVSRLEVEAPSETVTFKDNARPNCPLQVLSVRKAKIGGPRGLYLYRCDPPGRLPKTQLAPCCMTKDDEKEPEPPIMVEPLVEPKGEPKTHVEPKGEPRGQPGKGDGQPGKGDGGRKPVRPGRPPSGPQPTLRLPSGIDWGKVIAGLAALAAILSLTPWGRIGTAIGTALGALLRGLGLSLGIGGLAAASPENGSPSDAAPDTTATEDASGGTTVPPAPSTSPPGTSVTPRGTTPVPGGIPVPSAGTTPAPTRRTTKKRQPAAGVPPLKARAKKQTIKMKSIEGVNLERLVVGMTLWLVNYRTKEVIYMKVISKESKGKDTTVNFVSVVECRPEGSCSEGGNVYTVTHPYRPSDAEVFGSVGVNP